MEITDKRGLLRELAECLAGAVEVRRVVVFGSFLSSTSPNDVDVAVFQDSDEKYLSLAMRYRKLARKIAERIPLDIIPLRKNPSGQLLEEIRRGEVIYER